MAGLGPAASLLLLVTFLLGGCAGLRMTSAAPTGTVDTAIVKAIAFRASSGLRADEPWVRQVFADPAAQPARKLYGTPLMPAEVAELESRAANADEVRPVVEAYGAQHPDEYGGLFTDIGGTGAVVAQFTKHVAEHEAALRALLPPISRLEVRAVTWTRAELVRLATRIREGESWITASNAELTGLGVDDARNVVDVRIRTADEGFPDALADYFSAQGMVEITNEGPPLATFPTGTLQGRVVDSHGRPVAGVDIRPISRVPGVVIRGDRAFTTRDDGTFIVRDIPAVMYDLEVLESVGQDWVVIARGRASVPANGTETVVLTLDPS